MVQRIRMWSLDTAWAEFGSSIGFVLWGLLGRLFPSHGIDQTLSHIPLSQATIENLAIIFGGVQLCLLQLGGRSMRAFGAAGPGLLAAFIVSDLILDWHVPTRAAGLFSSVIILNFLAIARNVQFART